MSYLTDHNINKHCHQTLKCHALEPINKDIPYIQYLKIFVLEIFLRGDFILLFVRTKFFTAWWEPTWLHFNITYWMGLLSRLFLWNYHNTTTHSKILGTVSKSLCGLKFGTGPLLYLIKMLLTVSTDLRSGVKLIRVLSLKRTPTDLSESWNPNPYLFE